MIDLKIALSSFVGCTAAIWVSLGILVVNDKIKWWRRDRKQKRF